MLRWQATDPGDTRRFPLHLSAGQSVMEKMAWHSHAPAFRNRSGHGLNAQDLTALQNEAAAAADWFEPGNPNRVAWLAALKQRQFAHVPYFQQFGSAPNDWFDVPTTCRAQLAADFTAFVPDDIRIENLLCFSTSGSTGHPLKIPSQARVAARYQIFYQKALREANVEFAPRQGDIAVLLLGFQQQCFSYVSYLPQFNCAGLAKLNLHPNDWQRDHDRALYLDAMQAKLYTGDPISFAELLNIPSRHRPQALVSTSMQLSLGLQNELQQRFQCPVLDLYSMNETGPIAVRDTNLSTAHFKLLQPQLWVEILRPDQTPAKPGEVGEVTLSGAFNHCMPLLRYRTGDFAALECVNGRWCLSDLHGRATVYFVDARGQRHNNLEITHALQALPLRQWQLHQATDLRLRLSITPFDAPLQALCLQQLHALLGPVSVDVERLYVASDGSKLLQYSSDLD